MRPVEIVHARLDELRCGGRGRMRCCPAHDDHHPSLSVTEGDDARALLHCHAGCELPQILEALDLKLRDLYPPETWPSPSPTSSSSPLPPPRPAVPHPGPRPCVQIPEDEPELYGLIADYNAKLIEPIKLGLPIDSLRPNAIALREVALDIELLMGLRLRVDEDRPLPYSARMCASRCEHVRDERHAGRLLKRLVELGIVRQGDPMPRRPGGPPRGTNTFLPSLGAGASTEVALADTVEPLERGELVEEVVGFDPAVEVHQELSVQRAEASLVSPGRSVGVLTAGNAAGDALGNVTDGIAGIGEKGSRR